MIIRITRFHCSRFQSQKAMKHSMFCMGNGGSCTVCSGIFMLRWRLAASARKSIICFTHICVCKMNCVSIWCRSITMWASIIFNNIRVDTGIFSPVAERQAFWARSWPCKNRFWKHRIFLKSKHEYRPTIRQKGTMILFHSWMKQSVILCKSRNWWGWTEMVLIWTHSRSGSIMCSISSNGETSEGQKGRKVSLQ